MKNFDQFEKLVNINESEISVNINESSEAMALVKKFDTPTYPVKPYKRKLTDEEKKAMHVEYPMYSWSDVDAEGKIVLGGGAEARGKSYIEEADLEKVVELSKNSLKTRENRQKNL